MKIAVCFKLIMDYDQVPIEGWGPVGFFRPKSKIAGANLVSRNFAFFDEGALETALRMKDEDNTIELEAISLGIEDRIFTENLYAAGYNTVTYLQGNSDFDPENTAKELATYIGTQNFDLILTGESAGPLDTGSVPYLMAHRLDCPIINKLTEVTTKDNNIILTRESADTVENYSAEAALPLIGVISNAKYPYLRLASYEKKKAAKQTPAIMQKASNGKWDARFELPEKNERKVKFTDKEELALLLARNGGEKS